MLTRPRTTAVVLLSVLAGLPTFAEETRGAKTTAPKPANVKSEKAADKAAAKVEVAPKIGLQKPGVLIPFSRLKAEAEIPGAPAWVLPSDTLLVPAGDGLTRIDLKTNKPGEPITGFSKPCSGAVNAFKSLWIANCGNGTLVRTEPKTAKIEATLNTGIDAVRYGIAATSDSVWILADGKTTLSRIDPDTNSIVAEVRLPAGCMNLQFAETSLWVTCAAEDKLLRINPITNLVDQRIKVAASPSSLAFGDGSVWVLGTKEGKIDRIDPKTNKVTKSINLEVPNTEGSIAFGEGALWASLTGFPITRIDTTAEKETVVQQFFGEGGGYIYTTGGSVWLANTKQDKLLRLDTKRIIATLAE
jgi:virginiamycin B lyase